MTSSLKQELKVLLGDVTSVSICNNKLIYKEEKFFLCILKTMIALLDLLELKLTPIQKVALVSVKLYWFCEDEAADDIIPIMRNMRMLISKTITSPSGVIQQNASDIAICLCILLEKEKQDSKTDCLNLFEKFLKYIGNFNLSPERVTDIFYEHFDFIFIHAPDENLR